MSTVFSLVYILVLGRDCPTAHSFDARDDAGHSFHQILLGKGAATYTLYTKKTKSPNTSNAYNNTNPILPTAGFFLAHT